MKLLINQILKYNYKVLTVKYNRIQEKVFYQNLNKINYYKNKMIMILKKKNIIENYIMKQVLNSLIKALILE